MNWKTILVVVSVALNIGLVIHLTSDAGDSMSFLPQAGAQNRAINEGGYSSTTAHISSSRQALWVVDNREKRLVMYTVPPGTRRRRVERIVGRSLRDDFGPELAGDVVLLPGRISSESEAVYAIDVVGKKLIAYYSDGDEIEIIGKRSLEKDFRD